jgi:hypothetical protein
MTSCFFACGRPLWGGPHEPVIYVEGRGWCHRSCFKLDKARGFPFRMDDEIKEDEPIAGKG